MRYASAFLALSVAVLMAVAPAFAHHSFAAEFDRAKQVNLQGTVTKVEWQNPHVWFYMNVKNATTGKTENYGFELGPPHLLQGQNPPLTKDTIKIGTKLTVAGSLAKNGDLKVNASTITTANGQKLGSRGSADDPNQK